MPYINRSFNFIKEAKNFTERVLFNIKSITESLEAELSPEKEDEIYEIVFSIFFSMEESEELWFHLEKGGEDGITFHLRTLATLPRKDGPWYCVSGIS